MGKLDDRAFAAAVAPCKQCEGKVFEVASYIDRQVVVMLGEPKGEPRWTHNGAKFVDGVYCIQCARCRSEPFSSAECPRCHRGALADALDKLTRLTVPKRCPACKGMELVVIAFAPAVVRAGEGRSPAPAARARLGEPGFHVAQITCETCDWVAVAEGCPLCASSEALRARPG